MSGFNVSNDPDRSAQENVSAGSASSSNQPVAEWERQIHGDDQGNNETHVARQVDQASSAGDAGNTRPPPMQATTMPVVDPARAPLDHDRERQLAFQAQTNAQLAGAHPYGSPANAPRVHDIARGTFASPLKTRPLVEKVYDADYKAEAANPVPGITPGVNTLQRAHQAARGTEGALLVASIANEHEATKADYAEMYGVPGGRDLMNAVTTDLRTTAPTRRPDFSEPPTYNESLTDAEGRLPPSYDPSTRREPASDTGG